MSDHSAVDDTTDRAPELTARERRALTEAGVEAATVGTGAHSYRTLLDAGVEASVATAIRRRFSLPWSFDLDGDLDRRATEVSGLGEAERAWVAASADERWQTLDHRPDPPDVENEPTPRPYPPPTPIRAVTGVSAETAATLADAGITSAERLATIDARTVASVLDLSVIHVRTWRHNARDLLE